MIDGRDDDAVWASAKVIDGFRESDPIEDGEPPQRTVARITYDERHLYVFVRAYDSHPDSIVRRLVRRDTDVGADRISLYIDSYHDRRTGYRFSVSPGGAKIDGILYDDGNEDWAWDGVWDVATRVDSLGWTAEFAIPLSQLRYPAGATTFGVLIRRYIARYTANVSWPLYRPSRPGFSSQMADLTGLSGLATPRRAELTPYLVTKNADVAGPGSGRQQQLTLGGDLKYALSSNMTLLGTVNPDFGQVEEDPSVLNLTAFETFFSERRPFFVEGTGLFREPVNCFIVNDCNTGEGLFYSRRIGRPPQLGGDYVTADTPSFTPIAGATKLTGRTAGGLSIGVLDALTERVTSQAGPDRVTLEPPTNYAVVRSRQEWREGESNVGFIGTAVNRSLDSWSDTYLRREAYVGGVDFYHRFPGKRYQLSGQVNFSDVVGTPAAIAATQTDPVHYYQRPDAGLTLDSSRTSLGGNSAELRFAKFGGEHTTFETAVGRRSAGFEINDLGYLQRADQENWSTWGAFHWRKPALFYQWMQWNVNVWHFWTTNGLPTEHAFNSNIHIGFNNRWSLHTGGTIGSLGTVFCDRCARGGPAIRNSPTISWWGGILPDMRHAFQPQLWINLWRADGGRTLSLNVNPTLDMRFSSQLEASLGLNWTHNRDNTQWYDNVTDSSGGNHYLFAHLAQQTVSLTMRVDYTITPNVTLQVYASPFVSKGTYSDLRELANPRAADYLARYQPATVPPPSSDSPGFNVKQFRSNVVFRWEYHRGSTLFLVWQQGRQDSANLEGDRPLGGNLRDVFRLPASNTLLLKASYWLNW